MHLAAIVTGSPWAALRLVQAGGLVTIAQYGPAPDASLAPVVGRPRSPLLSSRGERLGWLEVQASEASLALTDLAALAADSLEAEAVSPRHERLSGADHRNRMLLSTIQTVAMQTARRSSSLEGFLSSFLGRLKALGSAEDLLISSRQRGAEIAELVAAALSALAPGQARWQGADILLTDRGAESLSAAVQELAANALRHGALSTESGRVEVMWRARPDGGFSLEWLESGGPLVGLPSRRGYGLGLLEGQTAKALDGAVQLNFAPGGLRAHVEAGPGVVARAPQRHVAKPAEPNQPAPQATMLEPSVRGKRILVVEDSVLLAMELEAGLTDAGAIVVGAAAEVDEALAMIGEPIDAAVLDANLNGRSVAPVAAALAKLGVPFIFATGYAESAEPLGFDVPIVRKPYNVSQVVAALALAAQGRVAA
ncbi:MAG: hypothetical protein JWM33_3765 [Caulobacteraceae bacterium]|nr:hypothetical protein [Caulobacteraceae bacterium]